MTTRKITVVSTRSNSVKHYQIEGNKTFGEILPIISRDFDLKGLSLVESVNRSELTENTILPEGDFRIFARQKKMSFGSGSNNELNNLIKTILEDEDLMKFIEEETGIEHWSYLHQEDLKLVVEKYEGMKNFNFESFKNKLGEFFKDLEEVLTQQVEILGKSSRVLSQFDSLNAELSQVTKSDLGDSFENVRNFTERIKTENEEIEKYLKELEEIDNPSRDFE